MRITCFIFSLCFLCATGSAQISTTFSFGSVGMEGSSKSMFTGPVLIDGINECLTIQNGINISARESSKGLFRLGCRMKETNASIFFNVFPNPSNNYIIVKSEQNNLIGNAIEIDLQDVRGTNLTHQSYSLNQLKSGVRIATASLANGLYLVKVLADKQVHTYKLIKTGNLR